MLLYRLLISVFAAAHLPGALRRGGWAELSARLGGGPQADQPCLWVHGASNGELASARPVLEALLQRAPGLRVLVTANSASGVALARGWGLGGVEARLAPLDLGWATRRFYRRNRVSALILLEAELWPWRILACPGPVALIGARMSAGTARGWGRFPRLSRHVLGRLALVSAQDGASRDRLVALGVSADAVLRDTDLKALYVPPEAALPEALRRAFPRHETWLAASTHESDEATVLDAHLGLLSRDPGQRLILAPRHPHRAEAIVAQIAARGMTVARRSLGEAPHGAQIYLADTLGDMALWYALAGRVFIGGSLGSHGGHTPYEPAAFGAALLHGPDMANFAPAMARLAAQGGATQVDTAGHLTEALAALDSAPAQQAAGARAQQALGSADAQALIAALAQTLQIVSSS